jgi:type IV pilus assembly protein PilE
MPRFHQPTTSRGFTLIELMITVVVIGILAGIAYPSFMDSIRKSRRAEAFNALATVQQAQERWRGNNAAYASDLAASAPAGLGLATGTPGGHYTISLADTGANTYKAIATANSSSSQVKDGSCAKLGVWMNGGQLSYGGTTTTGTLAYEATSPCWSR